MPMEQKLDLAVHQPWKEAAQDRVQWRQGLETFLRSMDLPWASGRQTALEG